MKKLIAIVIVLSIILSTNILSIFAYDNGLSDDVQVIKTIGMLKGSGNGVTYEYTLTTPNRLQAAIMFLRLKGLEQDALDFRGKVNFADAGEVPWAGGKAIMAYLKAHPVLGWQGDGTNFYPNNPLSNKEYYKVMLEALGYKQSREGVFGDFTWNNVIDYAEFVGLADIKETNYFTINDLAVATVQTLKTKTKEEDKLLINKLVDDGILSSSKAKVVSEELFAFSIVSGTIVSQTSIIVNFNEGVSSKLASDWRQYDLTVGDSKVNVLLVKYDEINKKAVLTVYLRGKTGTAKINGVPLNASINMTNLKLESASDVDSLNYNLYIKLSEYPAMTVTGKKIKLVKDSVSIYATCIAVDGLEAIFQINQSDRINLVNGIYVLESPEEDNWITIGGKTIVYPALGISRATAISYTTKQFTVTFTEYPIATLKNKKIYLEKDGKVLKATYKSISNLNAVFEIDSIDKSKLETGVYILSIPESDRWVTAEGKTVSYSTTNSNTYFYSANYDINTGKLSLSGSGFKPVPGVQNDISSNKITISNNVKSYTLEYTTDEEIKDNYNAELTLGEADKAEINSILIQNGNDSGQFGSYNIKLEAGWNGENSMEEDSNPVYVSGYPTASISSATYNFATGALTINGVNLVAISGENNDVNPNRFTISAQGGRSYTLTNTTPNVDISDESGATIIVSGKDRAEINAILTMDGTLNESGQSYLLNVSSQWNGYGSSGDSNNMVTVNNHALPLISSSSYNSSTGVLTLSGTGLRTIEGNYNDISSQKITVSSEGGATYTISSSTSSYEVTDAFTAKITLSSIDKININAVLDKNGMQNTLGQSYNISLQADWNGIGSASDLANNPITVSGYLVPYISSAEYNFSTGVLTLDGYNLKSIAGSDNDINAESITITAGLNSYTLTTETSNVDIVNINTASMIISGIDRANLNTIFTSNGLSDLDNNYYNIELNADWNGIGSPADTSAKSVTISNYSTPSITNAAYDFVNGEVVLTGEYLRAITGTANDIDSTKITFSDGTTSYTLTSNTQSVDVTSSNSVSLTVDEADMIALNAIIIANGLNNGSGGIYNIAFATDWNGSGVSSDLTNNPITVTNWSMPIINSATYDNSLGILTLNCSYLRSIAGSTNDIDVSKLTVSDGTDSYTLSGASSDVDITDSTTVIITVDVIDRGGLNWIFKADGVDNGTGGVYSIEGAIDWNGTDTSADLANPVTVSNWTAPAITSATYDISSGQLILTGSNFRALSGANNDFDVSKLTISDTTTSYELTGATSNPDVTDSTTAIITVEGVDKTFLEAILDTIGTSNSNGAYNIEALLDWNLVGSPDDLTGNIITVQN